MFIFPLICDIILENAHPDEEERYTETVTTIFCCGIMPVSVRPDEEERCTEAVTTKFCCGIILLPRWVARNKNKSHKMMPRWAAGNKKQE